MRIFIIIFLLPLFLVSYINPISAEEDTANQINRLNMGTGLTLSIIPGFGAGNYYAHNFSKGLTFTFIDASLLGISIWAYTGTKLTDYSVISIGVVPAVLLIFKVIQVKTVYDDIEAYNNRYIFYKP
ncbi:MAG: hypothetical protein ACPL7I_02160 [Myxococcota bacterium]